MKTETTVIDSTKKTVTKKTTTAKKNTTTRNTVKNFKKSFSFCVNFDTNSIEISTNNCGYEIYVSKDEYYIFSENKSSSFTSIQNNLFFKKNTSVINIYKENGTITFSTNLNIEVSNDVNTTNFKKNKDFVSFCTKNPFKLNALDNNTLLITNEICTTNSSLSSYRFSNDTLTISDEDGKVYLPYTFDEVSERFKKYENKYNSISDLIEKEYVLPISQFKNSFSSRFSEGFKLMKFKQHSSNMAAFGLALEVSLERKLHPAIITACKNLNELDNYLDCLEENRLEDFSNFKIEYKSLPVSIEAEAK